MKYNFKCYCKDYKNIENYEKALADNFVGWDCHHRLETHTSDGERRLVDITVAELQALDMYYNRPAEELIFLRKGEHTSLRKVSDSTREKLRAAKKGENHPMYGRHHTDEAKNKIAEATKGENNPMYGKKHSDAAKKKMSEKAKGNIKTKGTHWYNNGKINTMAKECPPGFVPGRIKKP